MNILVVDDHPIARAGVRRLLENVGAAIHEADNVEDAHDIFRALEPDVTILDIEINGFSGVDTLRTLLKENPRARVIMFSMHSDHEHASKALRAGAVGYVSKSADAEELLTAVSTVIGGGRYIDPQTSYELVRGAGPKTERRLLNEREEEFVRLLGQGISLAEIAQQKGLSYSTVSAACGRLKNKLGIETNNNLIKFCVEQRLTL